MRRSVATTILLLCVLAVAPVATSAEPRIPASAEEWASFTAAERRAALAYAHTQFEASLRNGTAVVNSIGRSDSGDLEQSTGDVSALAISVNWNCPIQWIDQIGSSYTRGGGWTSTSSNVYYLAASRVGKKGQFTRDGVLVGNWYHEASGSVNHVESWSAWNHRWSWEHFNFVNKGWHGARQTNGGTWLLGPDRLCSVSVFR